MYFMYLYWISCNALISAKHVIRGRDRNYAANMMQLTTTAFVKPLAFVAKSSVLDFARFLPESASGND